MCNKEKVINVSPKIFLDVEILINVYKDKVGEIINIQKD